MPFKLPEDRKKNQKAYREKNRPALLRSKKAYYDSTKEERRSQKREYGRNNKTKMKDRNLRLNYGISLDDYNEMVIRQSGICELCGTPLDQSVCVDHCHETNVVRGLIHRDCNFLEGWITKVLRRSGLSPEQLLESIVSYVGLSPPAATPTL